MLELIDTPDNHRIFLAALLGMLIGLERQLAGKDPGLRTFALISMGSCVFSMLSFETEGHKFGDPARVAAQIVSGIGFIGAGCIFRSKTRTSGLTTAALMWVTASIGMAIGFGRPDLAVATTLVALFITLSLRITYTMTHAASKNRDDGDDSDAIS